MNVVYTIGYEGSKIDEFIATLIAAKVSILVDVRDVSVSRKKGFSKNQLRSNLADHGIDYLHIRSLGDPKPGRIAARNGNFEEFERIYFDHFKTAAAQDAFRDLIEVAKQQNSCLMCYERDPLHCHRRIVTNQLADYQLSSFDLFVDRRNRYEQAPELLPGNYHRQSAAAA